MGARAQLQSLLRPRSSYRLCNVYILLYISEVISRQHLTFVSRVKTWSTTSFQFEQKNIQLKLYYLSREWQVDIGKQFQLNSGLPHTLLSKIGGHLNKVWSYKTSYMRTGWPTLTEIRQCLSNTAVQRFLSQVYSCCASLLSIQRKNNIPRCFIRAVVATTSIRIKVSLWKTIRQVLSCLLHSWWDKQLTLHWLEEYEESHRDLVTFEMYPTLNQITSVLFCTRWGANCCMLHCYCFIETKQLSQVAHTFPPQPPKNAWHSLHTGSLESPLNSQL